MTNPSLRAARSVAARTAPFVAIALAIALVASFIPVVKAQAYYTFGTVGVSTGSSYLSVQAGASTSTSVSVTPASDSQTLGCGMAKCPQVCESEGATAAGYHCFDTNGQCTCAGTSYSTYYPETSASSSNSGVATAYVSGGTLIVQGHSAGTASITVNASLRQWNSNSTTVQVDVSAAPAPEPEPAPTPEPSTSGGSSSGSASSSDAPAAAAAPEQHAPVPEAAEATDSRDDALNETVVETVAGKVYTVEKNSFLDMREELGKIVDTEDTLTVWAGPSSDKPDYSWTFVGSDVDGASDALGFDPTITVSKLGTGNVSNIMKQAKDGLVMEFAHEGALPGKASIYVKADGTFADGTELGLFTFNADTNRFERADQAVKVEGGYASFTLDHCSTWALSTDDLTAYQVEETNTPGAIAVDKQDTIAEEALPGWVVPAVVVAVIVIAAAIAGTVIARRRKAAEPASEEQPANEASADKAEQQAEEATADAEQPAEEEKPSESGESDESHADKE